VPGTLILQASTDEDLTEDETDQICADLEEEIRKHDPFDEVRTYYQEKKDVTSYGMAIKSNLSELAENPGNARYLGIFIIGGDGDIISEKFILNPAIKHEKGRTNLALSVLKQNDVNIVLFRDSPDEVQTQILDELDLEFRTSPEPVLGDLKIRVYGTTTLFEWDSIPLK